MLYFIDYHMPRADSFFSPSYRERRSRWFKYFLLLHIWFLFANSMFSAVSARENCLTPLFHRNALPVASIFLELDPLEPCVVPNSGYRLQVTTTVSNAIISHQQSGKNGLIVDQERYEQHLEIKIGLPEAQDLTLHGMFISDTAGRFDGMIRQFHNMVGLPQHQRKDRPEYQYLYWQTNAKTGRQIEISEPESGFGELQLSYRKEVGELIELPGLVHSVWGWRAACKIPQKGISSALGSGEPDVGVGLLVDSGWSPGWFFENEMGVLLNLGLTYLSESKQTVFDQNNTVISGMIAIAYPIFTNYKLVIQAYGMSPKYRNTGLIELDQFVSIFSGGIQKKWNSQLLSIGFTEDLLPSSEDVSLSITWHYTRL